MCLGRTERGGPRSSGAQKGPVLTHQASDGGDFKMERRGLDRPQEGVWGRDGF